MSSISYLNSTKSILTSSGVFYGRPEDVSEYGQIVISLNTDQDSAANGLKVYQSSDSTNWSVVRQYSITGNVSFNKHIQLYARYYKVEYTNGGTDQTEFRLQTKLVTDHTGHTVGQQATDDSVSVVLATGHAALPITYGTRCFGSEGNLWDNVAVSANGTSTAFDACNATMVSIVGNTSTATNLSLELSLDNSNYYSSMWSIPSANGNFHLELNHLGAKWLRLKSSASATITASAGGKA